MQNQRGLIVVRVPPHGGRKNFLLLDHFRNETNLCSGEFAKRGLGVFFRYVEAFVTIPIPLSTCRVLVVEDDYYIAREMEAWLRLSGAKVMGPVSSVSAALQVLAGEVPDIAVLDVNLSGGERSFPVAERLNELGIPYLFATGNTDLMGNQAFEDHPVLTKPVGHRELLTALKKLLRCEFSSDLQPSDN